MIMVTDLKGGACVPTIMVAMVPPRHRGVLADDDFKLVEITEGRSQVLPSVFHYVLTT